MSRIDNLNSPLPIGKWNLYFKNFPTKETPDLDGFTGYYTRQRRNNTNTIQTLPENWREGNNSQLSLETNITLYQFLSDKASKKRKLYISGILFSYFSKRMKSQFCNNSDGLWGIMFWSSRQKRQMPYDFHQMWNLEEDKWTNITRRRITEKNKWFPRERGWEDEWDSWGRLGDTDFQLCNKWVTRTKCTAWEDSQWYCNNFLWWQTVTRLTMKSSICNV